VCTRRNQREGGQHSLVGKGGPNSDVWRESLALFILRGVNDLRVYLADGEEAELVAPVGLEGFPAHRHNQVFLASCDIPAGYKSCLHRPISDIIFFRSAVSQPLTEQEFYEASMTSVVDQDQDWDPDPSINKQNKQENL
jgi:hypothetical protein